eukprot:TRINITY_DN1927_c0_g1_i1.p2 TRINITY_DN1927_c0_g1~~TRINITY_DN1927_c0_g1_i1.p2  ORF type:complete len:139 (-),score=50.05 TRINITY_DN1927_c0_g1_i1:80-496(-)
MILVKNLIMLNPDDPVPVRDIPIRKVPFVPANTPLYDMLNLFQCGKSHMAVVTDPADQQTYIGVLTLEDVFEQLIQEAIRDETDAAEKGIPVNTSRLAIAAVVHQTAKAVKSDGSPSDERTALMPASGAEAINYSACS